MQNETKAENNVKDVKPRKQKISASYTTKAFSQNIEKLIEIRLIEEKDIKVLEEIKKRVIENYMKKEMGL